VDFKDGALNDARRKVETRIEDLRTGRKGRESAIDVRNEMQNIMMDYVGIFRDGKELQTAVDKLEVLYERSGRMCLQGSSNKGFSPEMSLALRVPGMIKLAQCTAYGAMMRTESRGAHTRRDFPERNDRDWLNRTLAYWKEGATMPELHYEDASPYFEMPPGDRGYGGGQTIPNELPEERLRMPEGRDKDTFGK
jgi:fumarate reductase flavoprotein subunit